MRRGSSVLIGLLTAAGLACSHGQSPSPTETAREPTPVADLPTATPTPAVRAGASGPAGPTAGAGQTQADVRWTPVQLRPLFDGVEMAEPFADDYRSETLPRNPRWALYLVEGAGDPRQLYSSPRLLQSVTWPDNQHLSVSFRTKRLIHHPFLDGDVTLFVGGSLEMERNPPGAHLRETVESAPSKAFTISGGSLAPGDLNASRIFSVTPDPGGDLYLITKPNFPPPMPGPGILTITSDVYISDAAGTARHLEGISRFSSVNWLAGGRYLVGLTSGGPGAQSVAFIPTTDGQAIVIDGIIGAAVERTGVNGEDNGYRVAFTRGDSLKLFDARSGTIKDLGKPPIVTYAMAWEQGTDSVLFGNVALDVVTGAVTQEDPESRGKAEEERFLSAVSPDGRRTARFESPGMTGDRSLCLGLPYRFLIIDNVTGARDPLIECESGTAGQARWVGNDRLVLSIFGCWACDGGSTRILLVDVKTREVRSLTQGLEAQAFAVPSPDASRVLVAGSRLRLYSAEGVLLHDYGPPPAGFEFRDIRWSPDGSAFAFLLGPRGWHGL